MKMIDELRGQTVTTHMPGWVAREDFDKWKSHARWVRDRLLDPIPIISIDNVADYYFIGTDQEMWSLETDFPNLAPPFDSFWMEFRLPQRLRSTLGDRDLPHGKGARVGCLFLVAEAKDVQGEDLPKDMHWCYCVQQYVDGGDGVGIRGPIGSLMMAIGSDGRMLLPAVMQTQRVRQDARVDGDRIMASVIAYMHPALLAISFLHCKNVEVVNNEPPAKLAKRTEERHGIRPCAYKTLIIEPLKQILRKEGGSDKHGIPHAMHICRGHFKDYRGGKGLFGKYHQLVWHPQLVRGTRGEKAPPREIEIKV